MRAERFVHVVPIFGAASSLVRGAKGLLWASLTGERERWLLWLPAGLGLGIGFYFALPAEPPLWPGPVAVTIALALGMFCRRRPALLIGAIALGVVALGFAAAALHTASVAEPTLGRRIGPVELRGRIVHVDTLPDASRIILDQLELDGAGPTNMPARARIRIRGSTHGLRPGQYLAVKAVLLPPPGPVAPGAFDFQRYLFFRGIGAVGYAVAPPRPWPTPGVLAGDGEGGLGLWLAASRQDVVERINQGIDGASGAVAAALMTGERHAIPAEVLSAFRDSGIAHLLAISGLHIGLVAGILFFGARALLALMGPLALHLPVKKMAAVAALLGALGYLVISGATVPTQRAYLMLAIVLLGVLVDRVGLSMRLVAWAAVAVLLIAPESLLSASFQMSFAAVIALVAVYEALGPRIAESRRAAPAWSRPAYYIAAVALTTLVAGLATAPFAIFHFNRLAAYGLIANLGAVPLTALWIMPWAVIAFVFMPIGLEGLALAPMGWGIDAVVWIARTVASWDGAVTLVPAMPGAGLVLVAIGGLWLALWRRRWRIFGAPMILAGLATVWLAPAPDILISGDGRLLAVRSAEGQLLFSSGRAGRFSADAWLRRAGQADKRLWPSQGTSADGSIACDGLGCVYRSGVEIVALARDPRALGEDCRLATIVVSGEPVRVACSGANVVIDRFDLWKKGSHALWLSEDGVVIRNARDTRGDRPWVPKPEQMARRQRRN